MSKTRGNVLDPDTMAEQFGIDGVRYMVLREVPFDRDADVSCESFVRRYNADLANDFGNLLNRTLTMTTRFLDGERPAATQGSALAHAWQGTWATYSERLDRFLLHDALAALWDFVGEANRLVDREQPWALAKQAREGDANAAERLRGALGDLLEALRLVALTVAPFMPDTGRRVFEQLGLDDWPYAADGSGGPPLADAAAWGTARAEGRLGTQQILFPRVELAPADEDAPSA